MEFIKQIGYGLLAIPIILLMCIIGALDPDFLEDHYAD